MILPHLLNLPPFPLLHGFVTLPTSVTVVQTEEWTPGSVYFRCQLLGDTGHLRSTGEPCSPYTFFAKVFQG